ncbi:MAG: hypothetical protein ACXWNK_07125 [Vulcanimicrobiaceae bacterium]
MHFDLLAWTKKLPESVRWVLAFPIALLAAMIPIAIAFAFDVAKVHSLQLPLFAVAVLVFAQVASEIVPRGRIYLIYIISSAALSLAAGMSYAILHGRIAENSWFFVVVLIMGVGLCLGYILTSLQKTKRPPTMRN